MGVLVEVEQHYHRAAHAVEVEDGAEHIAAVLVVEHNAVTCIAASAEVQHSHGVTHSHEAAHTGG
jgi:hypothetical protein